MPTHSDIQHVPFRQRLQPAPVGGGFAMDDWWVWCGSTVRDSDGQYHLFAARWPRELRFLPAYQSYSEVVRATADRPEGPYTFADITLPDRGADYWDGRMTHNPVIVRWRGQYLLFYIGTTFDGPRPTADDLRQGPAFYPWYRSIRIGVATADDPGGPWTRRDEPLLVARPGEWDEHVVTNPSPCVTADDRLFLYYRSFIQGRGCRLGLAIFDDIAAPPVWRSDAPLFDEPDTSFEDPFVWQSEDDGHFEMLAKDLTGNTTGELHAGTHLLSRDGIAWHPAPEPKAYSRELQWDDGVVRRMSNIERPFLLIQDGAPTHLFAAMGEGPTAEAGAFDGITRAWNGVVPLR